LLRTLVLVFGLVPFVALADEQRPPLRLSALPAPNELATLLWERSPSLQPSRLRIADARAGLARSHLLPNPGLDLSWNSIPIGETNPPGLAHPLANIPNYAFGVSSLVEIGKRGPRQLSAASAVGSTLEDARATLFDTYFDLGERIAAIAAAEVRIASLAELAGDARKLTELQRARAEKGDAAQLDADRAAIEEEKLWTALADERAKLAGGIRECGVIAGAPCEPFGSSAAAEAYLGRRSQVDTTIEDRPDLRSLELQRSAAAHALDLANARKIPDPTLRFGYVHDQFLVSGNQGNSLFVGLSLPLTFFDHGQADARFAQAAISATSRARELLVEQAHSQLTRLSEERGTVEERRARLEDQTLPLARSVVKRLEEVVRRGGAPLQEVLLARRTLGELTVEAADLDLSAHQLAIAESRIRGEGPPAPPELRFTP
jgi:outer membrane protein, heavy metal efflux system